MGYMYSIDVQPRTESSTFGALYTLLEKMDYNYLVAQDTFTGHTGKMGVWVTSPAIGC